MRVLIIIPLLLVFFALCNVRSIAADTSTDPTDTVTNTCCPVTDDDKRFLGQILRALKKKDFAWIADHMDYPISIDTNSPFDPNPNLKKQIVNTKEEFLPIARQRFSDDVCARIAADAKKPLFKNWRGVMVGDGILWFSQYGTNDNGPWTYEIDAIGKFTWQPEDKWDFGVGATNK